MRQLLFLLIVFLCAVGVSAGRSQQGEKDANQNQPPPRSDEGSKQAGESSSRDNRVDLSPPPDDAKDHPNSSLPLDDTADNNPSDVQEFHTYDPHRAAKDIEVGDFYFKKKNYGAALERYRESLLYKPNDAFANLRMAQALEKMGRLDEASERYREYLKILPNGPQAEEAKKALEKIKANAPAEKDQAKQ